jgi:hypothetical protein
MGKLRWTSALIQKIWQVAWDQWEHRNAILNDSENLTTQAEAVMIFSRVQIELATEIQGILLGDRYLFHDHLLERAFKWTVDTHIDWLDTVAETRQSCTVSLARLRGIFDGEG